MYFLLPFVFRFDDTFHRQSPSLFVVCLSMFAYLQHFMLRSSWNKMDAWVNRYLLQSVTPFFFFFEPHWRTLCVTHRQKHREKHIHSHTQMCHPQKLHLTNPWFHLRHLSLFDAVKHSIHGASSVLVTAKASQQRLALQSGTETRT